MPITQLALSSLDRFWVLTPAPNTTSVINPNNPDSPSHSKGYGITAPSATQTGWLWNGVHWHNPAGCHTQQEIFLVPNASTLPRARGNPHYNAGAFMPPAVAAAALSTADLLSAAPISAFPSIHLGCVGFNVLQDPILWVR
jgi:hypothetical protein